MLLLFSASLENTVCFPDAAYSPYGFKKVFMNAGIRYTFFVNLPGSEHNRLLIKEE